MCLNLNLIEPQGCLVRLQVLFLFVSQRNPPVSCFQVEDLRASISCFWRSVEITPHEILYRIFSTFA